MLTYFKNMKIRMRIILSSIVLIAVTVSVVSYFYYQYAYNDIKREYYQHADKLTRQVGIFFNEELSSIISRIFFIKYNAQINETLKEFLVYKRVNYGIAQTDISRILSELEDKEEFLSSIYIYTAKGDFYDYDNFKRAGFSFKDSLIYQSLKQFGYPNLFWGSAGTDEIFQNRHKVIPVSLKFDFEGYSDPIFIIVNLNADSMLDYLKKTIINEDNEIVIMSHAGADLVSTYSDITRDFFANENTVKKIISGQNEQDYYHLDTGGYLITYYSLKVVNWHIVNIQSERALTKSLNSLKQFIIFISITSIAICLVISVFISNAIIRPLKNLENIIHQVTYGNLEVQCSYPYENEIGHLSTSFNFMIFRIRELIERLNLTISELETEKKKVETEQELKRKAELMALQAQINPHFLYNTLSSIIWLASSRDADDICQIASDLGDFYRIALSRGKEVISVQDEIKHVENYLSIQKFRYGDKISYAFDIDEEVLKYTTIKLILQPLVENAIYHGIKNIDANGEICIKITYIGSRKELEMVVHDNGAGIEPGHLADINSKLSKGEAAGSQGYGIFNVNERIRLFYGSRYGLRLESEPDMGTYAILWLPAVYTDKGKEDNSDV